MSMLETQALTREFGGVIAVNKVDFVVEKNMITGLIGPNGAGKTTLFNNITGLDVPTSGKVFFEGKEITGTKADKVCRLGIARSHFLIQSKKNSQKNYWKELNPYFKEEKLTILLFNIQNQIIRVDLKKYMPNIQTQKFTHLFLERRI